MGTNAQIEKKAWSPPSYPWLNMRLKGDHPWRKVTGNRRYVSHSFNREQYKHETTQTWKGKVERRGKGRSGDEKIHQTMTARTGAIFVT